MHKFDAHTAMHRNIISIVKPTRCTNVLNLFYFGMTLHVLDGLYVHHQEFKTVHTATGICQTDNAVCLLAGMSSISYPPASRQQYHYALCTMALGLTQVKRNEYQEYFLGGKGGWCAGLTTLPPLYADSWNLGASPSWNPQGLSRPVMGFLYLFTALALDTLARKNCQSQAVQSNISSWELSLQLRICPYGTLNIALKHWHVYGLSQCFIPIPIIRKYFCIVFIVQ